MTIQHSNRVMSAHPVQLPLSKPLVGLRNCNYFTNTRTWLPSGKLPSPFRWLTQSLLAAALMLTSPFGLAAEDCDTPTMVNSRPLGDNTAEDRKYNPVLIKANTDIRAAYDNTNKDLEKGILNVTKAPYCVVQGNNLTAFDTTLNTKRLQKALTEARDARLAAFLPVGVYLVNNTLECIQGNIDPNDSSLKQFTLRNSEFPCVLRGSTLNGGRAVIKLRNSSPDFEAGDTPRPVIFFSSRVKECLVTNQNPCSMANTIFPLTGMSPSIKRSSASISISAAAIRRPSASTIRARRER